MGKIISVVNQKGGVGKTTTSVNVGAYLASLGKHILIVDIDPQANATSGVGIDHKELEYGIYEALIGHKNIRDVLKRTVIDRFMVAPATAALAGAGIELVSMNEREFILQSLLDQIKEDFDYIIIDGPPSLGLMTINSLVAADDIIIPIQSEYYALEGLGQLLETISLVKENLKPNLNIMGAVVTMYDKRNKLSSLVLDELEKHFPNKIFNTVIPRSVRLAEAPSYGKTIMHYDTNSRGGKAYEMLAREIVDLENNKNSEKEEDSGLYFGD